MENVNNEYIVGVQALSGERYFFDLEGSGGIRNLQYTFLLSDFGVITSFRSGFDCLLSTEELPEEISMSVLVIVSEDVSFDLASSLIVNSTSELCGS